MREIFTEIGFGNESFFSTEIEEGRKEYRVRELEWPGRITGVYFRIWIFKLVLILSTLNGLEFIKKNKNRFKFIFGVRGISK
tara:strand:- start:1671 stop:1916 length:246 start_codon:yes stop_codon:yes gene_type:complete